MQGGEQTSTAVDMLIVVEDGPDPELKWPDWMNSYDNEGNELDYFTYGAFENDVAVGSAQSLDVSGKSVQAFFAVGEPFNIDADVQTIVDPSDRTKDLINPWQGSITYSISGGADADKFGLYSSRILFLERPSFDNPGDANGDNTYEVEVSATNGTETITKTIQIEIMSQENNEKNSSDAISLLTNAPVFSLDEIPERIGNTEDVRNISGTAGDDCSCPPR